MTKTFREALEAMEPVGYVTARNALYGGKHFNIEKGERPLYTADQAASAHAESVRELVEACKELREAAYNAYADRKAISRFDEALQRHESGAGGERPVSHAEHITECKRHYELGKEQGVINALAEQTAPVVDAKPTDAQIDVVVTFMNETTYLHHPRVRYEGTESGDSEESWKRRWSAELIRAIQRASSANAPADRESMEALQRERLKKRFEGRAPSPATADFDFIAPNDPIEPADCAEKVCEWRAERDFYVTTCGERYYCAIPSSCPNCIGTIVEAGPSDSATGADKPRDGAKLWLWKNGDHFLAFANEYPCYEPAGDPMTLGEPAAVAIFQKSFQREGKS